MSLLVQPPSRLLGISDGDTPDIRIGVRMLGYDAPELHFPEGRDVALQNPVFAGLPKLAAYKKLPKGLRDHLAPKLVQAGSEQKEWGLQAKAAFEAIVAEGLAVAGTKRRRNVFYAYPAAPFDRYGRILAYVGPYVSKKERGDSPPPDTFNLRMLAGGWAAPYLHKDNLPKKKDLDLAVGAVQNARKKKLGIWKAEDTLLLAYEFRALVRLARGEGGFSYPTSDLRSIGKSGYKPLAKEEYIQIPVEYRVFG